MGLRSFMKSLGARVYRKRVAIQSEHLRSLGFGEDVIRYAADRAVRDWTPTAPPSDLQRAFDASGEERQRIMWDIRSRMVAASAFAPRSAEAK